MEIIITDWNNPTAPIYIAESKTTIKTNVAMDYEVRWKITDKNGNIKEEGVENGNYN
ncbi:MAG: hypothetical protein WC319_04735 [Candidatus Paceibacterota bacterium]|jgi:hypothetical protein